MDSRTAALDAWSTGTPPAWAAMSLARQAHVARVAALLDRWAAARGLDADDRRRWRLAGWLHDALRDAEPERIRDWIADPELRALPGSFLHGPAAADRLSADGVDDAVLLDAIRYHTLGRDTPTELELALMVADALEPGRAQRPVWRAALRARMPEAVQEVAREVVREKLERGLALGDPLRREIVGLWNALAGESP